MSAADFQHLPHDRKLRQVVSGLQRREYLLLKTFCEEYRELRRRATVQSNHQLVVQRRTVLHHTLDGAIQGHRSQVLLPHYLLFYIHQIGIII